MADKQRVRYVAWLELVCIVLVVTLALSYVKFSGIYSRGVIDGLLYVPGNSSVLIDGQALNEGDTIYGVEIVEIDRRSVEFRKYDKHWSQRVRERPSPGWDYESEEKSGR